METLTINPTVTRFASLKAIEGENVPLADYITEVRDKPSMMAVYARQSVGTDAYDWAKKQAPAYTLAASFKLRRWKTQVVGVTGLMAFDVDQPQIAASGKTLEQIRGEIASWPFTVICHRSLSGNGLRFVVYVGIPDKPIETIAAGYNKVYKRLCDQWANWGVQVDELGGLSITRLSIAAPDLLCYINLNPAPLAVDWPRRGRPRKLSEQMPRSLTLEERKELTAALDGIAAACKHPAMPMLRDRVMFRLDWLLGRQVSNEWLRHHWPDSRRGQTRGGTPVQDEPTDVVLAWLLEQQLAGEVLTA